MGNNGLKLNKRTLSGRSYIEAILIVLAVVLLVVAGEIILTRKYNGDDKPTYTYQKGPHNQTYNKLESFTLKGSKEGSGLSFSRPDTYTLVLETAAKDQVGFSHSLKSPVFAPLGALHAVSVSTQVPSKDYLKYLNATLANSKDNNYKGATEPVRRFVTDRFSPLYDLQFAPAVKLTTANIKENAWSFDFSGKPKASALKDPPPAKVNPQTSTTVNPPKTSTPALFDTSKSSRATSRTPSSALENYKGRLVFVLGKNAYYYFVIYNTDYNWNNNSDTWKQIIQSIKIDQ